MEIFKHLFWKKEKFMPTYFSVDHFYSYKTYSGCYEGAPPALSMIQGIRERIKKMWGPRATYIMGPSIRTKKNPWEDKLDEYLPRWTHMAWVNSSAMSEGADGSELVISMVY